MIQVDRFNFLSSPSQGFDSHGHRFGVQKDFLRQRQDVPFDQVRCLQVQSSRVVRREHVFDEVESHGDTGLSNRLEWSIVRNANCFRAEHCEIV
jgi:hypothetical protein